MDDYDAKMLAVGDARKEAFLPLKDDLPFIRTVRVNPAQHLHQGRLAGTVLAADRVDFALADREIDIAQRDDAGKSLCDPPHFQNGSHDSRPVSCGRRLVCQTMQCERLRRQRKRGFSARKVQREAPALSCRITGAGRLCSNPCRPERASSWSSRL